MLDELWHDGPNGWVVTPWTPEGDGPDCEALFAVTCDPAGLSKDATYLCDSTPVVRFGRLVRSVTAVGEMIASEERA